MIRIGNKVVAGSVELDLSTVLKSLNKTGLSYWIGTQAERDALPDIVKNDEKTTFITYDTDKDIYLIVDTIISYGKTWSSVKISSELAKKINALDVYTKQQVDEITASKLASALKYKGTVNTTALLPASATNGDTYFVKADGFMYAYNSIASTWDALGTVADMTNYFTRTEITAMLQDKADKFQYDVLPTASAETVGLLLQYTGADTEKHKNGYFYKGIDNGDNTYGWGLAKTGDYYSKVEADDSGLFAHGDNAPFLENSTITNYLTGLDTKYKFATFTVSKDNTVVSDKVNTTQQFSYHCYRQNASWRVIATDSATGKDLYTTDISTGTSVSWSKLATQSDLHTLTPYSGNLNNLVQSGVYRYSASYSDLTNIPSVSFTPMKCYIEVWSDYSNIHQTVRIVGLTYNPAVNYDVIFVRSCYYTGTARVWGPWKKISTETA